MSVPIFQVSKLRHRDVMRFGVAPGVWPCSDPLLCRGHNSSEEFQNGLAAHLRRRYPFWPGEETQRCRQAHTGWGPPPDVGSCAVLGFGSWRHPDLKPSTENLF